MEVSRQIDSIVISSDDEEGPPTGGNPRKLGVAHQMRMRPRAKARSEHSSTPADSHSTNAPKAAENTNIPAARTPPPSQGAPTTTPRIYQRPKIPRTLVKEPPPVKPNSTGSQKMASPVSSKTCWPSSSQASAKPQSSRTSPPNKCHPEPPTRVSGQQSSSSATLASPSVFPSDASRPSSSSTIFHHTRRAPTSQPAVISITPTSPPPTQATPAAELSTEPISRPSNSAVSPVPTTLLQRPIIGHNETDSLPASSQCVVGASPSPMRAFQMSSPPSLPAKRPRNENADSSSAAEPSQSNKRRKQEATRASWDRHPSWWRLDGSVVIRCGYTVFKLHRTILAGASPYFAELFQSIPTEFFEENATGKLPIYEIAFDNETAFAHTLNLLYNALSVYHFLSSRDNIERLSRSEFMQHVPSDVVLDLIIRASTALSFSLIRDWAIKILEAQWSTDLTQVTATPARRAVETILLAKICRIPQALKRACYEAVRINNFGSTMLFHDREPPLQGSKEGSMETAKEAEPFVRLSSKNVVALFRAHGRLADAWVRCAAVPPPAYQCAHGPQSVVYDPARWNAVVHASGVFVKYMHDPITGIAEIRRSVDLEAEGFCGACRVSVDSAWTKCLELIWKNYDVGLEADLLA